MVNRTSQRALFAMLLLVLLFAGRVGYAQRAGKAGRIGSNSKGTPFTWGYNKYGQLGNNGNDPLGSANGIYAITDAVQVAGGAFHSLALSTNGSVWAWGYNKYGQLGNNTNDDNNSPVNLGYFKNYPIVQVSAGTFHSLALAFDKTVWAWGYNSNGQLGDGTASDRNGPVQVKDLKGIVQIAAGGYHSLALKNDGTVWAWGNGGSGQLGNGANSTLQNTPVQVTGLDNVVQISGGYLHSLALKNDGTVWAWGWNGWGQLGDGTATDRNVPVKVNIGDIIQVSAGGELLSGSHSLALKSDGTVWGWGANPVGQLGDGTKISRRQPVQAVGLTNVMQVSAGGFYSLAIRGDNQTVWAWGDNQFGELSDNYNEKLSTVPVLTIGSEGKNSLAAGYYHGLSLNAYARPGTLGLLNSSKVYQYGSPIIAGYIISNRQGFPIFNSLLSFWLDNTHIADTRTNLYGITAIHGYRALGTHSLTVNFAGNEQSHWLFDGTPVITTITVVKADTTCAVPDFTAKIGETITLSASVKRNTDSIGIVTTPVTFKIDDTVIGNATSYKNGIQYLTYKVPKSLLVGDHTLTASFGGDNFDNPQSASSNLHIDKGDSSISANKVSGVIGQTVSLIAFVSAAGEGVANRGVSFFVDGYEVGAALTNRAGKASLRYLLEEPLTKGIHFYAARFYGDDSFSASLVVMQLVVSPADTFLSQTNASGKAKGTVKLTAKLKRYTDGKSVAGRNINFYVDGAFVGNGTTDAKGGAVFAYTITQPKGTYPISATFDGDDVYSACFIDEADLIVK